MADHLDLTLADEMVGGLVVEMVDWRVFSMVVLMVDKLAFQLADSKVVCSVVNWVE